MSVKSSDQQIGVTQEERAAFERILAEASFISQLLGQKSTVTSHDIALARSLLNKTFRATLNTIRESSPTITQPTSPPYDR